MSTAIWGAIVRIRHEFNERFKQIVRQKRGHFCAKLRLFCVRPAGVLSNVSSVRDEIGHLGMFDKKTNLNQ